MLGELIEMNRLPEIISPAARCEDHPSGSNRSEEEEYDGQNWEQGTQTRPDQEIPVVTRGPSRQIHKPIGRD